jgi:urease gamma subunit
MSTQSHKPKKLTKKQMIEQIPKVMEQDLKKNFIKNLVQGFEISNQMILDKINSGASLEKIKNFVEMNLKNKDVVEKVANGVDKVE